MMYHPLLFQESDRLVRENGINNYIVETKGVAKHASGPINRIVSIKFKYLDFAEVEYSSFNIRVYFDYRVIQVYNFPQV